MWCEVMGRVYVGLPPEKISFHNIMTHFYSQLWTKHPPTHTHNGWGRRRPGPTAAAWSVEENVEEHLEHLWAPNSHKRCIGFHPAADIQSRTGIGAARSHVVDISIIIITKANEMISSLWVWDQICTAKPTVRAADFVNIIIYFFICNIQAWDFAAWSVKKNRALFSWPFLLANFLHFKTFLSLNVWANSNLIFLLYCSDPRLI